MAIEIGTLVVRGSFGTVRDRDSGDAVDEAQLRRMLNDLRRTMRRETEELIDRAERSRREG